MKDELQIFLQKATGQLADGQFEDFVESVKDFYHRHITCNCFFRDNFKIVWNAFGTKAIMISNDDSSYYVNFIKGFVYTFSTKIKIETVYNFLSKALVLKPDCDISFSLRASLGSTVNHRFIEDALQAVFLNPSSRNYYILSKAFQTKGKREDAINYFEKSISIDPYFACAFYSKGSIYQSLENYEQAITSYSKCLELNPFHWCYYNLWQCFDKKKQYSKAIKMLQTALRRHPNDYKYIYITAVVNAKIKNYEKAVFYLRKYLSYCPKDQEALESLKENLSLYKERLLNQANYFFKEKKFEEAIQKFEAFIEADFRLDEEDLNRFYLSVIKFNKTKLGLAKQNSSISYWYTVKIEFKKSIDTQSDIDSYENVINSLLKYTSSFKVRFGKYKNLTIEEIIFKDPDYILWCIINLKHFCIEPYLFLLKEISEELRFLEALEINLLKSEIIALRKQQAFENDSQEDDYEEDIPSYGQWLIDEFGDDAETAYWNLD